MSVTDAAGLGRPAAPARGPSADPGPGPRPPGRDAGPWRFLRHALVVGPALGILWTFVAATTVAVALAFATEGEFPPSLWCSAIWGAAVAFILLRGLRTMGVRVAATFFVLFGVSLWEPGPLITGDVGAVTQVVAAALLAAAVVLPLAAMLRGLPRGLATRHEAEEAMIRSSPASATSSSP